jgi:hypothetical protein
LSRARGQFGGGHGHQLRRADGEVTDSHLDHPLVLIPHVVRKNRAVKIGLLNRVLKNQIRLPDARQADFVATVTSVRSWFAG